MSLSQRTSIYDRLRPHLDAADLIRRLGINLVRTIGSEAYCDPICHDSTSKESLQINLHTGRWNCKACQSAGVYGDLFQLVEYVLTGGSPPSRGDRQGASICHREAIIWLCDQFGIPFDENRVTGDPGLDVVHMVAMAAHQCLLDRPDVLEWVQEKWGFDCATVAAYGIGFMPSPILPSIASESQQHQSRQAFRSSGLGWFTADGAWRTRFEGRVLFPYLEGGRAVYLIGRSTPWTQKLDSGARPPKYHKLSVHSDDRPFISKAVTNDHLYNEPVLSSASSVVVAEGVADAVALSALGVPVVSPVTISFNATDLERFTRKAAESKLSRVEILFDNELSGSGNFAARRVGLKLVERGLVVKILTLPLGDAQRAARDEIIAVLGAELFEELERSDPRRRKEMIVEAIPDEARRSWLMSQVELSKIDAAEWSAIEGAGAAGRFDSIRKSGVDVIHLEVEDIARNVTEDDEPFVRADLFSDVIELVAHVDDRLSREAYAGVIAKSAGAGVTKAEIARRIAAHRRDVVKPKKKKDKADKRVDHSEIERDLIVLPPEAEHVQQSPPAVPKSPVNPKAPVPPPLPGQKYQSDHERYDPARKSVARCVSEKVSEETVGNFVSQTIMRSMGFTPFRTPEDIYLVRGSERIPVGLSNPTPRFASLVYLAAGLTPKKSSHKAYIAAVVYFIEKGARKAQDVSWSHVSRGGAVFFPTGDKLGRILKISAGSVERTKMAEVKVPAVAGDEFDPFKYVEGDGGVRSALEVFRWTSISPSDRLVLVYWIACLPILRRVGTIPIVRIEGGSSSGKTRTVDAVSWLVNGKKSSSVPTAAALVSRMSTEMLTIDDNRETVDVSPAFLGTLLQATHLGAREKRKGNTDTGTVVERVCGALLMNGIEPIHDGRSELASRMLTLQCREAFRAPDSPRSELDLRAAMVGCRDAFWSEAARLCSQALDLDRDHGETLGAQIEEIFGSTKIGRLSAYLRLMVLAWIAGQPVHEQPEHLATLPDPWVRAFRSIAGASLDSLLAEELSVSVLRYVFAFADTGSEPPYQGSDERHGLGGKYVFDAKTGDAFLGPLRAVHLARLAREAGKLLNAPRAITSNLRAGQLERRIIDGLDFLGAAGFEVSIDETARGRQRFTFLKRSQPAHPAPPPGIEGIPPVGGDTWTGSALGA